MTSIKSILGDRLLMRRLPAKPAGALPLLCRYEDCDEHHPVATDEDQVTCESCRDDLGLPPLQPAIVTLPALDDREPPFEAVVFAVGRISEPIAPGDTILCAAPRSQNRVGTRRVLWQGRECELMSTLDVVGVLTQGEP